MSTCLWCDREVRDYKLVYSQEPVFQDGQIFESRLELIIFLPCNHAFENEAFKEYRSRVTQYNEGLISGGELKESLDNCLETVQTWN